MVDARTSESGVFSTCLLLLPQTNNDLETQWRTTNYAFRRRIHEFEEAKSELEWQKKNVGTMYIQISVVYV